MNTMVGKITEREKRETLSGYQSPLNGYLSHLERESAVIEKGDQIYKHHPELTESKLVEIHSDKVINNRNGRKELEKMREISCEELNEILEGHPGTINDRKMLPKEEEICEGHPDRIINDREEL